jgi:hypothetical protein
MKSVSQKKLKVTMFLNKYLIGHNGFIAGGCFKDIFLNNTPRDIDIFFRSSIDFGLALMIYKANKNFDLHYSNGNAIGFKEISTGILIELVHSRYGSPSGILSQFDFSVCKFALTSNSILPHGVEYVCLYSENFFEDLSLRNLNFEENIMTAGFCLERTLKYSKYGFSMNKENLSYLVEAIFKLGKEKTLSEINLSGKTASY